MKPGVKPMTEPERTADAAAKDALDLLRVYLNRDVTMETQRLVSDAYDVLDRAMEGPRFGDDVREQADAADWRRRFIGRFRREPASP
jgi:plasmid stabilization system protein ParE